MWAGHLATYRCVAAALFMLVGQLVRCIAISNGHMHDYAFLYMHIVLCICRDINYVCAFENIFAFRVVLTRSICINYLLS